MMAVYLHIGGDNVIGLADVIAVLDARTLAVSPEGAAFITAARAQGRLIRTGEDKTNAYVVTTHGVYASAISTATLKRRAANPQSIADWE